MPLVNRSSPHLLRPRHGHPPVRRAHLFSSTLIALLALVPVLLAGCGDNAQALALAKNQVFVWPYTGADKINYGEVLDPDALSALEDLGTVSMLYTNLVTLDNSLHVAPDAALKWDVDPTGTVYTFHLRPNMHFNDGAPITAQDFAYGIDRALDPTICSKLDDKTYGNDGTQNCLTPPIGLNYLGHLLGAQTRGNASSNVGNSIVSQGDDPSKGVNVLDPLTLRLRLDKPVAYFLEALTYSTTAPMEKSFVENPQYAGGTWVDHLDLGGTSGPFKVKSYNGGKQLTLVPNPYWEAAWGKKLTLTEVDRPMYLSQDTEYSDYRAGKLDYTEVPPDDYNFARGQSDFHEIPTLTTDYFGLNFKKAPFDNPQVRVAFDLALNKQLLVDRIESGADLPTNHIVPSGMIGFNPALQNPPPDNTQSVTGNQQAAETLLQQAQQACQQGKSPAPDSCPYITGTSPKEIDVWTDGDKQTRQELVTAAAANWSSALSYTEKGQTVKLNVVPKFVPSFGDFLAQVYAHDPNNPSVSTNPYQAWQINWAADYPDPQDFLSLQFASQTTNNAEGIASPDLDKLFQQADTEQNPTQRMAEYATIEQDVVNLAPWIPFQQEKFLWRQRTWVNGFTLSPVENMADIYWPNVYITEH